MASQADEATSSSPDLAAGLPPEVRSALARGHRALQADGDLLASRAGFERAYLLAEQAGEVPAMAEAALGLAGLWVSEDRTVVGAALRESRLQHVLSLLDPRSSLALRVRTRLAGEDDYRAGEHDRILAMLAEARATADPLAVADALNLAHHCLLGPGHAALRRELATELIKISFRTGRRSDRLMGLMWQTVDSFACGDPHAGRVLGELRDELARRGHAAVGFIVSAIDVMLAIRAGQLGTAEALAAACAASGASAGDIDSQWWPGAQLVAIRWYQGRLGELAPTLRDRVHSPALSAVDFSAVAALAVAAALNGDRQAAASCLASLRGGDLGALPRSSSWLVTMNGVVEAAYLVGDADTAALAYRLLSPYADLPMVGGLGVICLGSAQQSLGVAALAAGDLDRAVDHLGTAVRHNLSLPHWPALVSSRHRLAQAYLLRGRPGDAEAARLELDAADADAAARELAVPGRVPEHDGSGSVDCQRRGRGWRLTLADRSVIVDDSIGMLHLAVLFANPRRDIAAADLVAGLAGLAGATAGGAGDQPLLDAVAISEYRSRLRSLDDELDRQPDGSESAGAASARAEREWLAGQLANAAGLRGRPRSFPADKERARIAVGKAVRRAMARIAEADPVIGDHVRQCVRTGTRCSYWPS